MKKIFTILLICAASITNAQKHYFGVNGAVGSTNISRLARFILDQKMGFYGGFSYDFQLMKRHRIGADLQYIQMGIRPKISFTDQYGNNTIETHFKYRFNYLTVPIKWTFLLTKNSKIQLSCGVAPSLFLYHAAILPDFNENGDLIGYDRTASTTAFLSNRFNLAGFVEIGTEARISKNLLINPKATFRHNIPKPKNPNIITTNGSLIHYGLFLGVGLKYNKE